VGALKRCLKFITSFRSLVNLFVRKLELIWISRFDYLCSCVLQHIDFLLGIILYYITFFFKSLRHILISRFKQLSLVGSCCNVGATEFGEAGQRLGSCVAAMWTIAKG